MKKHALIIGSTDSGIGATEDTYEYASFLRSKEGGCWNDSEIEIVLNPTREATLKKIKSLKFSKLDFLIFIFSGHGFLDRTKDETIIELSDGRHLKESEFLGIKERQLSILDCCRAYASSDDLMAKRASILLNEALLNEAFSPDRHAIRKVYEKALLNSPPAPISIFSCSRGEYSQGESGYGGLFSQPFIKKSRQLAYNNDSDEITLSIGEAYSKSKPQCTYISQHPCIRGHKQMALTLPWVMNLKKLNNIIRKQTLL